ncbi:3-hydroxyacyl-CoA dehydrogenase family protein [Brevibacillus sp. SYSU BS000544]|uniref:3-hydroxyacyl-CoA dehydrogenase family protein n=1 Tax=Brevibacillus sp. SYSU BS000544 TaxID=3416443 RepID=UPI003CE52A5F
MEILKVAVIGAGLMGSGIAQAVAQGRKVVHLYDISPAVLEKAILGIQKSLSRLAKVGQISSEDIEQILQNIKLKTNLQEACEGVQLVIEAVPEHLELKKQIFKQLDQYTEPDCILATNTSELSVTAIAAVTSRPTYVLGMHWFNPAPIMRLIEIVRAVDTDEDVIQAVHAFSRQIGKETVIVRDAQGFVTTRALAAHMLEGMRIYEEGIASREDVDKAIRLGLNYPMGPLELADLVGLDTLLFASEGLVEAYGDRFRPPQILKKLVEAGHYGKKTGKGFYEHR